MLLTLGWVRVGWVGRQSVGSQRSHCRVSVSPHGWRWSTHAAAWTHQPHSWSVGDLSYHAHHILNKTHTHKSIIYTITLLNDKVFLHLDWWSNTTEHMASFVTWFQKASPISFSETEGWDPPTCFFSSSSEAKRRVSRESFLWELSNKIDLTLSSQTLRERERELLT